MVIQQDIKYFQPKNRKIQLNKFYLSFPDSPRWRILTKNGQVKCVIGIKKCERDFFKFKNPFLYTPVIPSERDKRSYPAVKGSKCLEFIGYVGIQPPTVRRIHHPTHKTLKNSLYTLSDFSKNIRINHFFEKQVYV